MSSADKEVAVFSRWHKNRIFNDAVGKTYYTESIDWMAVNNELERMW
jgi:hypothetical protein